MQLRKCCGHPYLFEGVEDRTLDPLGEHLVENCGKLSMVDKLLARLKARDHRVLIFTQMTRVLDILEDYMVMRGYQYCRIDGNTTYESRESQIDEFNAPNSEKFCFILSTRAGTCRPDCTIVVLYFDSSQPIFLAFQAGWVSTYKQQTFVFFTIVTGIRSKICRHKIGAIA